MSQEQYTAIQKMRLIDLAHVPAGQLIQYLSGKPRWEQEAIWRMLASSKS